MSPKLPRENKVGPVVAASRRRLRWGIGLGALLACSLGLGLAFTPIVRSVAQARAEPRGLIVKIGSARPGWMAVHLRNVDVEVAGSELIATHVDAMTIGLSSALRPQTVAVTGGKLTLNGSLGQLRNAWTSRKAAKSSAPRSSAASTSTVSIEASGLQLEWRDWGSPGSVATAEGIRVAGDRDGQQLQVAAARFDADRAQLRVADAILEIGPSEGGARVQSMVVERVEGKLRLATPPAPKPREVAAPTGTAKPTALGNPQNATAVALVNRRKTSGADGRPSGRDEPATPGAEEPPPPTLASVPPSLHALTSLQWESVQAKLRRLERPLRLRLAPDAKLQINQVQMALSRGDSMLNFGPAPLRVQRNGESLHAEFRSAASADGQQLAVEATVPLSGGTIEARLSGGPVPLQTLGVQEGNFGLQGVNETRLRATTKLSLSEAGLVRVSAEGGLDNLSLQNAAIAPEPLRQMNLRWGGDLEVDLAKHSLTLSRALASLGDAEVHFDASVQRHDEDLNLSFRLDMDDSPCQAVFEAAPPALLPLLQGLELRGSLGLHASLQFDTAAPLDAEVKWQLRNRCKVVTTPPFVDPKQFSEAFTNLVLDGEGRAVEVTMGPTTEDWVPLEEISSYLQVAVMVCEDAKFFTHKGFNNSAIRDSIASNLRAGRFVRGASTVSMQLAKNLYLGREKTLSRKFQEAALTMLLEERLNKEDILELYFNVVEFGPGIYGIRQAAQHYFDSHPGELSLAQALYFGSILPNPKASHFEEDGELNKRWAAHLRHLMRVAHRREHISQEELAAGTLEELRFGQRHTAVESDTLFGASLFD